jgi:hypothetical protein
MHEVFRFAQDDNPNSDNTNLSCEFAGHELENAGIAARQDDALEAQFVADKNKVIG